MNTSSVSDTLARSTIDHGNGSPAEHLGNTFRECNILSGFTLIIIIIVIIKSLIERCVH